MASVEAIGSDDNNKSSNPVDRWTNAMLRFMQPKEQEKDVKDIQLFGGGYVASADAANMNSIFS